MVLESNSVCPICHLFERDATLNSQTRRDISCALFLMRNNVMMSHIIHKIYIYIYIYIYICITNDDLLLDADIHPIEDIYTLFYKYYITFLHSY